MAGSGPKGLIRMGFVYEDLEDHEGYIARRLPDGSLTASWTAVTARFTGYIAACSCGWRGEHRHAPNQAGREAAERAWDERHALPLLAEAIPARVRDHMSEMRSMIAELAVERPAAARRLLDELAAWSHGRIRMGLAAGGPAADGTVALPQRPARGPRSQPRDGTLTWRTAR